MEKCVLHCWNIVLVTRIESEDAGIPSSRFAKSLVLTEKNEKSRVIWHTGTRGRDSDCDG
jgi:hypothetical protein